MIERGALVKSLWGYMRRPRIAIIYSGPFPSQAVSAGVRIPVAAKIGTLAIIDTVRKT